MVMSRAIFYVLFIASIPSLPSHANDAKSGDPAANMLIQLYMTVCIPNMGRPDQVKAWVAEKQLPAIQAPVALDLFVGPGGKGGAWAVPSNVGNFVVSIRGQTEACAVWARTADPSVIESDFKTIVEGVARPGIKLKTYEDKTVLGPLGRSRSLIYQIKTPSSQVGFLLTMLTAERSGGAFQASLQIAKGQGE